MWFILLAEYQGSVVFVPTVLRTYNTCQGNVARFVARSACWLVRDFHALDEKGGRSYLPSLHAVKDLNFCRERPREALSVYLGGSWSAAGDILHVYSQDVACSPCRLVPGLSCFAEKGRLDTDYYSNTADHVA